MLLELRSGELGHCSVYYFEVVCQLHSKSQRNDVASWQCDVKDECIEISARLKGVSAGHVG